MSKRIMLLMLAMVFVFSSVCYGALNPNNWGNTDTNPLLQKNMPYTMTHIGVATDGTSQGVSQVVSGTQTIPVDVMIAQKYIGTTTACTLENGVPGQILYIWINAVETARTMVLTPTTKWGFATLTFNAVNDSATLLYVNDYYGWILIGSNSVTIA
jgi:hypothetical protein